MEGVRKSTTKTFVCGLWDVEIRETKNSSFPPKVTIRSGRGRKGELRFRANREIDELRNVLDFIEEEVNQDG